MMVTRLVGLIWVDSSNIFLSPNLRLPPATTSVSRAAVPISADHLPTDAAVRSADIAPATRLFIAQGGRVKNKTSAGQKP